VGPGPSRRHRGRGARPPRARWGRKSCAPCHRPRRHGSGPR
jgi:hypothetical protein